jgi:PEP-CTERM motif
MRRPLSLFAALLLWGISSAASPITYHVTVNSSTLSGIAGSLDLEFNPGPLASQPASLQILNFISDGSLGGPPQVLGNVIGGPPPAAVTFTNSNTLSDYFEGFTFGSEIDFDVRLFGPALSSPDGTSTSGSTFGFSMFSDAAGTIATLTSDPSGLAFLIDVNLDGTSTVTSFSPATTVQAAPEPGTLILLAIAFACGGSFRRSSGSPLRFGGFRQNAAAFVASMDTNV